MPTSPEAPAGSMVERTLRGTAFGLRLEIDPEIEIPGISSGLDSLDRSDIHAIVPDSELEAAGAGASPPDAGAAAAPPPFSPPPG